MKASLLLPPGYEVHPLQVKWGQYFDRWRDSLTECAHKPTRKNVHTVRGLTLRLGVLAEYCVHQLAADAESVSELRRWGKEGRKLRREMAPIRDADVFLGRLSYLKSPQMSAKLASAQLNPTSKRENAKCMREIEKLTQRVQQQRQEAIEELAEMLEKRAKRLKRVSVKLEDYLDSQVGNFSKLEFVSASGAALTKLATLGKAVPSLDSASLHSFRKGVKEALYLAELAADTDAASNKLAVTLRKMHVATGDWHDWHALAQVARSVLPEYDELVGVVPVLEKLSEDGLLSAVEICQGSAARLLKVGMDDGELLKRKPVGSVLVRFKDSDSLRQA